MHVKPPSEKVLLRLIEPGVLLRAGSLAGLPQLVCHSVRSRHRKIPTPSTPADVSCSFSQTLKTRGKIVRAKSSKAHDAA
jgi:hypothetical protein